MNRIIMTVLLALIGALASANAQTWSPPSEAERCPSKWGAGDERGSANHMGPETVLRATRLIRQGQTVELGHVLHAGMPLGNRQFSLLTKPTFMNPESNQRGSNEELVVTELGQVGTQFDGFAHQTVGDKLYNCFPVDETLTRTGFTRFGMQNIGTLMTRGVLLDIAKLKGVEMLPNNYEITVEDLQQALARANLTLQPGDAVIINTGWGRLWTRDGQRPRHRHRRGGVARYPRPDDPWLGQSARRDSTEPRSTDLAAHPSDDVGRKRHPSAGAFESGRPCRAGRV